MKTIKLWTLLEGIREGRRDLPYSIKYDGKVYFRDSDMITYANVDNPGELLTIDTIGIDNKYGCEYEVEIVSIEDPESVENDINDLIYEFRSIMKDKEIASRTKRAKLFNTLSHIREKVKML